MSSHAGISAGRCRQLGIRRDHAELLLASDGPLAQGVPAVIECTLVPGGPFRPDMVRGVRGARRPVHEERLVGHERFLLADPVDRAIGHVLGEVVALVGRPIGLDRHGVLIDGRGVLVRLATDEAVEMLEPVAGRWPAIERPHRTGLPDRHLVAFAEMRGGVAVELQDLGERRLVPRPERAVAGGRRGDLRDAAHAHAVVVAPTQQRGSGRRAQGRGMEPRVLEPAGREPLERRRVARSAEGARCAEADVVKEDDEDVRGPRWRPHRVDRGKRRVGVPGVIGGDPDPLRIRDREHFSVHVVCH